MNRKARRERMLRKMSGSVQRVVRHHRIKGLSTQNYGVFSFRKISCILAGGMSHIPPTGAV
jgi:hypothetical protein